MSSEIYRITPLPWVAHETYSIAETPFGEYTVRHYTESDGSGWEAVFQDNIEVGHFPTDLIATSACQKDYEQRIYSAIEFV
jgi:hypothetical protein